jgi:hypothetical protein
VLGDVRASAEIHLLASNKQAWASTWATATVADLILELLLLLLLKQQLLLVELLDCRGIDVSVEVRAVEDGRFGCFLDPEILWWFEVVPEDRDDLLDLLIAVVVNEEVKLLKDQIRLRRLGCRWVSTLHRLSQVLILLL